MPRQRQADLLRTLAFALVAIAAVNLTACIDASRVNRSCHWVGDSTAKLDLTRASDRAHLREDAQLAWENAQRYADIRYRTQPALARPLLDACRAALYDSIVSRHGVTRADVETATFARAWWTDITLVFLPMLALTAVVMSVVVREVRRSSRTDKARLIVLAMSVGLVALIATGVTQMWAMTVETWRLRNEHIAGRAFVVPSVAHPAIAFASLCVVAALVAMTRSSRSATTAG